MTRSHKHINEEQCNAWNMKFKLIDSQGNELECFNSIKKVVELIRNGNIVAIKGIGGFHLCCDAKKQASVAELRRRKNRPDKPLAVMIKNIDIVHKYCEVSKQEQEIITNRKRPIVLLRKKTSYNLPDNIVPHQKRLGVMLPYLPLHNFLFDDGIEAVIMTSGNKSGTPIQYDNLEAVENLNNIADYFLLHDDIIHIPVDDSVVKVIKDKEIVSRRSRGNIPYIENFTAIHEILALGAEQKSTFCVSKDGYVYLSQYLGDLKDMDSYGRYKLVLDNFLQLNKCSPKVYAHDLHPQYLSTKFAQEQLGTKISIQHHHAHMVSCMAEHNLNKNVIGVIFDGTGLGDDGNVWGGEFLVGDRKNFKRLGYLKPVLLQGGDTNVKEPWKTAVSYMYSLGYDPQYYLGKADKSDTVNKSDINIVQQALMSNLNCHWSSSMGRFFDCISSIIGVRQHVSYDAQAAIEMESILDSTVDSSYDYYVESSNEIFKLDYESIISGVLIDIEHNISKSVISAKFHNTISNAVVDIVCRIRNMFNLNDVVLSGGVFENIYLLESVCRELQRKEINIFFNERIPTNDSGISVGQLAVADELMKYKYI